jgi:tellurium resistance protein TerD
MPALSKDNGISLRKDQGVTLSKSTGPKRIMVGLGWDTEKEIDLDASAFLLNSAGKVRRSADLIYYGATEHESGAVIHTGDNRSGEGDGDDEVIVVEISKIPADIQKVVFTVTIYDEDNEGLTFNDVDSAYIRLVDISKIPAQKLRDAINDMRAEVESGEENGPARQVLADLFGGSENKNIARYDLANASNGTISLEFAEMVRKGADWDFVALGNGFSGDLGGLCGKYGVKVN